MYRYEVTESVKNDINGVVGRPLFYNDGGKFYIDDPNHEKSIQYWDSATDSVVVKTLDDICQDLYSSDFDINSTQEEYSPVDVVSLSETKSPVTGRLEIQVMKPEGSSATIVSHDFTDKCTWYQGSIEVTGESLTDSGDGLTFNSANDYWIDLTHGRVYSEDFISPLRVPKVYVDSVEQNSGYSINYESGDVTFDSSPSGAVSADYWHASSGTFTVAPDAGKILTLEHAEVQFTKDCNLVSPLSFEIWAYNPYDLPNKVPVKILKYKSMKDIINTGNLGTGYIPAIGNITNDILVFPFNYITVIHLKSSQGLELRITSDNDDAISGEWGTVTLYVMSEDE